MAESKREYAASSAMRSPALRRLAFLQLRLVILYSMFAGVGSGTVFCATAEDKAKAVLDDFAKAGNAKDVDRVGSLLAEDCIILMTEPVAGADRARLFTKASFLKLLGQRYAEAEVTKSKRVIYATTIQERGDVFVISDFEQRTKTPRGEEWLRSHEYILMKPVGNDLLIKLVVAEMVSYSPKIPPNLEEPPEVQGKVKP